MAFVRVVNMESLQVDAPSEGTLPDMIKPAETPSVETQPVKALPLEVPVDAAPTEEKSAKNPRPNFNVIYRLPIPIVVHPVPTFFPTNPIWLLTFVYKCAHQFLFASSHPSPRFRGIFSPETGSIHINDPVTVRKLWEQGFFGKGSLSRSEPTWLNKQKRKQGILVKETHEEITMLRRKQRKAFKMDRAKKEREAIERRLIEEGKRPLANGDTGDILASDMRLGNGHINGTAHMRTNGEGPETTLDDLLASTGMIEESGLDLELGPTGSEGRVCEVPLKSVHFAVDLGITLNNRPDSTGPDTTVDNVDNFIENQEHFQLTLEESFFLVFGLGVLDIYDRETEAPISTSSLFSLFRQHSYIPPATEDVLRPDDPFILSYVVYHHFRSLGWVIRSGIKFGVDYLLYNRGPVFAHAEFAIVILPSYGHPYYSSSSQLKAEVDAKQNKSWWWLHCVNRVQSQVKKTLILVYVEVPPPISPSHDSENPPLKHESGGISGLLQDYRIREISLKRWIPNRTRD